jgi:hypothetical protein
MRRSVWSLLLLAGFAPACGLQYFDSANASGGVLPEFPRTGLLARIP